MIRERERERDREMSSFGEASFTAGVEEPILQTRCVHVHLLSQFSHRIPIQGGEMDKIIRMVNRSFT